MITSPVLILGCPRSGSTLLYRLLSELDSLWSIGGESKYIIERFHHPREKGWESGELAAADLTPGSRAAMLLHFEAAAAPASLWRRANRLRGWLGRRSVWRVLKGARRSQGAVVGLAAGVPRLGDDALRWAVRQRNRILPRRGEAKRLLEKTPENCLRLPFLLELFPDARVIHLVRDGRSNVSSLMEGWRHPELFPGYRIPVELGIPQLPSGRWAFTLIPGWRELAASPLEEICAHQWVACNEAVLEERDRAEGRLPYLRLRHEELVARPGEVLREAADFIGVSHRGRVEPLLPANVVSDPEERKWERLHRAEIRRVEAIIAPTMGRLGYPLD